MNSKLTLTLEQKVIEAAKRYAKEKGRSLSDLVESYLKALTINEEENYKASGSIVASLLGSFKELENFDYKRELQDAITDKHLKNG